MRKTVFGSTHESIFSDSEMDDIKEYFDIIRSNFKEVEELFEAARLAHIRGERFSFGNCINKVDDCGEMLLSFVDMMEGIF